ADVNRRVDAGAVVLPAVQVQSATNMSQPFFHVVKAITSIVRTVQHKTAAVVRDYDLKGTALEREADPDLGSASMFQHVVQRLFYGHEQVMPFLCRKRAIR